MRALVLSAVLTLLPAIAFAQGGPTGVGVQVVETRNVAETVPVFAEVLTSRDGSVASRVGGYVDRVNVLAGMRVEEGDLLVELNEELLTILVAQAEAQTAEAQAAIDTAQVRLNTAETGFARIEALTGSSSFSQGRFDEAQSAVLEAKSQIAEAQARKESGHAQLAEAQYQLDRSAITAPFSGVVLEVNTIPGAFIQAGTPVVRLLDINAFEVQASVPARYVTSLEVGQTVNGNLEGGEEIELELRAVLPVENPSTRTRSVRFLAPDLGDVPNIAVGQSLTVQIPVGPPRSVLSVPKDALVQSPQGWTVFVAADGKAEPRTVEIGVPLEGGYEVLTGLAEGDRVVVRGNERLRPGQEIAPNDVETN